MLNYIYTSLFLIISRVYKSCIGNFAQISSKLVRGPNYMCHFTLWSLMAIGNHFLAKTFIKHLLLLFKNHHLTTKTILLELNFLPQPLLDLLYLQ